MLSVMTLLTNVQYKLLMVGALPSLPAMEDLLVPDVLPFGWFYLTLPFASALDRSLECLHSFIWFDIPVKDKTSHAFQRPKKLRISAEKMQKYGT